MNKYIGVKIIHAELMTIEEYNKQVRPLAYSGECQEGYKVTYEDGYVSWSPKDVFEKAYRKTDNLTFGLAIEALKKGFKVARVEWKGYWKMAATKDFSEQIIIAHCKDGMKRPAPAYQEDILAEDWRIVE